MNDFNDFLKELDEYVLTLYVLITFSLWPIIFIFILLYRIINERGYTQLVEKITKEEYYTFVAPVTNEDDLESSLDDLEDLTDISSFFEKIWTQKELYHVWQYFYIWVYFALFWTLISMYLTISSMYSFIDKNIWISLWSFIWVIWSWTLLYKVFFWHENKFKFFFNTTTITKV